MLLTKNDNFDDLSCSSCDILYFQSIVTGVIDCCFTHCQFGEFSSRFNLDAVKLVLHFDSSKEPGADRCRSAFDGNVEHDWLTSGHIDDLLRDASQVNLRHDCNDNRKYNLIFKQCSSSVQTVKKQVYHLFLLIFADYLTFLFLYCHRSHKISWLTDTSAIFSSDSKEILLVFIK